MPDIFVAERNADVMRKRDEAVRKQQVASVNSRRRADVAKAIIIVGLGAGCAWLTYSNGKLSERLANQPVVYAVIQANDEVVASTHYAEVPPAATQDQQIQNALWTYIQARDCFGSSSPLRQYY
jgi:hypothetical protein